MSHTDLHVHHEDMDESRTDLAELAFEAWQTETAEASVGVQTRRPVDAWRRAAFVYI